MYDVCVIGHITRDKIRIGDVEKELPGGVAYYFPITLKTLDTNVCVVTKLAKADRGLLNDLFNANIDAFQVKTVKSTFDSFVDFGQCGHMSRPLRKKEKGVKASVDLGDWVW